MSPLKGNCKVLFKITLFLKKTTLPRSLAINQPYVQAPNLQTHLKANYLKFSFPHAHLPSPGVGISRAPCRRLISPAASSEPGPGVLTQAALQADAEGGWGEGTGLILLLPGGVRCLAEEMGRGASGLACTRALLADCCSAWLRDGFEVQPVRIGSIYFPCESLCQKRSGQDMMGTSKLIWICHPSLARSSALALPNPGCWGTSLCPHQSQPCRHRAVWDGPEPPWAARRPSSSCTPGSRLQPRTSPGQLPEHRASKQVPSPLTRSPSPAPRFNLSGELLKQSFLSCLTFQTPALIHLINIYRA